MKLPLSLLCLFGCLVSVTAQERNENFPPPEEPLEIRAIRTSLPIKIDGKLNEADWKKAIPITDFFRMEPRQGGDYKYKTEVRILFDDKNLYIGAFVKIHLVERESGYKTLGETSVGVKMTSSAYNWTLKTSSSLLYSFQTTPYGNQRDLQNFNDQVTDNDWNALWTVRTSQVENGYYAEFAIPFKSLRYDALPQGEQAVWGVTFYRLARRAYEQTVFSCYSTIIFPPTE